MPNFQTSDKDFLAKLTKVTEANLINPQFGVSMLAKEMGMSRSNLHRKVNLELKISVSQFINHERLKKAKEILRHTSKTVSEIAYEVGFSNVSYFIKCFHEYYGYSPGEVGNREEETKEFELVRHRRNKLIAIFISIITVIVLVVALFIVFKPFSFQQNKLEKTIAILPPENWETADSNTIYGIIQSVHNNLCKIKNITKITPWISVEQYKNTNETAPNIAKQLKVNYLVKPRIWKNSEKVILGINLIEGRRDKLLEPFVYDIDSTNVTTVHLDIIKDIIAELDVPVTREEQGRIDKVITSNRKAHKLYWQGVEMINNFQIGEKADLHEAIVCFEKALKYDNQCAAAYAQIARVYFILDYHWTDSQTSNYEVLYDKQINYYADEAMRFDSQLDLSLIAKALYYRNEKNYEMAIKYLQEALKYKPNSIFTINHLAVLYSLTMNSEKFIEYALRTITYDFPEANDNNELGIEYFYYMLGVEYRRLGFFDKALEYQDKALQFNSEYLVAINAKSQVLLDLEEDDNYQQARDFLLDFNEKDSTLSIYFFLGQAYYVLRDYQKAYLAFKKGLEIYGTNEKVYQGIASGRLAVIFKEMGEPEKAKIQINNYRDWAEYRGVTRNKSYFLTGYYSFLGDTTKALEQLTIMSKYDHPYFRIRLLKDAPLYDNIRKLPKFQQIVSKMETRFNEKRDSIRVVFEKKELL